MSHSVILADCLGPDGLATLGDKSVDHVITDPPYSILTVNSAKGAPRGVVGGYERRDLGYEGISNEQRTSVGAHLARIARRWILVFCDSESTGLWRAALEAGGARHKRMGVWVIPNPTPQFTGDRPGTGFESVVIAHAPGRSRWNGGGRPAVWTFNRPLNGSAEREATGHPTPKSLPLMEALVRDFTDESDLVCDPFTGSGTTGIACRRLGRSFVGFEREPRYHAIAQKRIAAAREQFSLLEPRGPEPKQASLLAPVASLDGGE